MLVGEKKNSLQSARLEPLPLIVPLLTDLPLEAPGLTQLPPGLKSLDWKMFLTLGEEIRKLEIYIYLYY